MSLCVVQFSPLNASSKIDEHAHDWQTPFETGRQELQPDTRKQEDASVSMAVYFSIVFWYQLFSSVMVFIL